CLPHTLPSIIRGRAEWTALAPADPRDPTPIPSLKPQTLDGNQQVGVGRFSTDYKGELRFLEVAITHLTKSDSGQYRCGTGTTLSSASFTEFGLRSCWMKPATLSKNSSLQNPAAPSQSLVLFLPLVALNTSAGDPLSPWKTPMDLCAITEPSL
uniref:Immunoglobulin V-set domain-containing protein n=1 Tax=Fundulus heteroclitus TaxID=8078 RepID=A0A3Q2PI58_FUNHE